MSNITCCKDCKTRAIGCHATCESYIKEKEANKREKDLYKPDHMMDMYKSDKRFARRNKQLRKYGKSYL